MPETRAPGGAPAGEEPVRVVIGFDFGLRRIGAARGDTLTRRATPLPPLDRTRAGPDWQRIDRYLADWQPALLVVGLPYNADGSEGALAPEVRAFARSLSERFARPVEFIDERYSSLDAQARLARQRAAGTRRRRVGKADVDAEAACVILERWFDAFATR